MCDFIVKLLLDLRKLLDAERIQVDYKAKVSARDTDVFCCYSNVLSVLALLWFP